MMKNMSRNSNLSSWIDSRDSWSLSSLSMSNFNHFHIDSFSIANHSTCGGAKS